MVTLIGALVVVLALATVAMVVTALALGMRGFALYQRATVLSAPVMRNARESKTIFERLGTRARRLRDALLKRIGPRAGGARMSSLGKAELAHGGA